LARQLSLCIVALSKCARTYTLTWHTCTHMKSRSEQIVRVAQDCTKKHNGEVEVVNARGDPSI